LAQSEPRIAYLASAFGRTADTFIRNEVDELRRIGVSVDTYSIRRPPLGSNASDDVVRHQQGTVYILEAGAALFWHTLKTALLHPVRFARALWLAWRTSATGLRGLFLQCAYVIEAGYLASRLIERKTDIVHDHVGENSATVAMLAAEMSGIPFSMTIHGPSIFYAPVRWALGEKLARAAFTACISHYCRSQCLLFAPQEARPRLRIVRCSVQPIFVDHPPPRRLPHEPHFVCVGRLCSDKGQRLLIEAGGRLFPAHPSARISLVGDGPDRSDLEQMIQIAGLQGHISILGWQSSSEVRDMLASATALVIPSLAEGLPVVAMEALAVQCPVIATNIAAISELVENGVNGWLIPPGSVDQLVTAMDAAANCDAATLERMGATGRSRVLELHDPVRQTQTLLELFRGAAKNGGDVGQLKQTV
jgi:glycosyltransferase involved in cell wall biosynthesis